MSKGYRLASQPAKPFELVQTPAAGSVSSTAENMARYMIAYLEDGGPAGPPLMKPETRHTMFSRAFGNAPEINGMALGFYEENRNGHRIVGHGGDTQWFHSDMHLMLDDNIGFFVSYNSAGNRKGTGRTELWRQFLDRYFPYTPPPGERVARPLADARSIAGTYWSSRRSETTVLSGLDAVGQAEVTVNSDTTISTGAKDVAGNPKHYREIAPLLFREVDGQDLVGFTRDYAGRMLLGDDDPFAVGQRTPLRKSGKLNMTAVGFALAMFLLTLLFWPVNAMLRRHYGAQAVLPQQYRQLRVALRVACLINLAFVGFLISFMSKVINDIGGFNAHQDGFVRFIQFLGLLGVLGAIVAVYHCVRSWSTPAVWVWAKVWNTLLALGFALFAAFVLNWHLLSPTLRY
jgi:Beta-lactamase